MTLAAVNASTTYLGFPSCTKSTMHSGCEHLNQDKVNSRLRRFRRPLALSRGRLPTNAADYETADAWAVIASTLSAGLLYFPDCCRSYCAGEDFSPVPRSDSRIARMAGALFSGTPPTAVRVAWAWTSR